LAALLFLLLTSTSITAKATYRSNHWREWNVPDCSLRLRNKEFGYFCYSLGMGKTIDATWTAEDVMKTYPQTVAVFLALKTDCVGCHLERFCTLAEVASSYELPISLLLEKLGQAIIISNKE